jgi:abequosyltransferase
MSMSYPLLTVIVPTYKRSANLEILLRTLREETRAVRDEVVVYVSDNCSPDDTAKVVARWSKDWPSLRTHRHVSNVGPGNNFYHCVRSVQSRWFWIIGDDDLPKRGVIAEVLTLLRERQPALVYMQSEWMNPVLSADQGEPVGALSVDDLDAFAFAVTVHTWLTFISGMVIDRERLECSLRGQPIDRFNATSLVQLGWILPLLDTSGPFLFVNNRCILATSGNTGGYRVLDTFCVNFPRIIDEFFDKDVHLKDAVLRPHICEYLPGLIWQVRFGSIGEFRCEGSGLLVRSSLRRYFNYWFIIWPIVSLPRFLAWPFYAGARLQSRLKRVVW